jgi:hypothetical protein
MSVRISPPSDWLNAEVRELGCPAATIEDEALDQVVDQARTEILSLLRQARLVTERSLAQVILDSLRDEANCDYTTAGSYIEACRFGS